MKYKLPRKMMLKLTTAITVLSREVKPRNVREELYSFINVKHFFLMHKGVSCE